MSIGSAMSPGAAAIACWTTHTAVKIASSTFGCECVLDASDGHRACWHVGWNLFHRVPDGSGTNAVRKTLREHQIG